MASKLHLLPLLVALSFLVSVALADPKPTFTVHGRIYCDTCRAGFETSVTDYIQGAKVKLECRHYGNGSIVHTTDGVTDSTGTYELKVEDDHQEEICEVVMGESPLSDCSEIKEGRDRARILLTQESGIHSTVRYANALGYFKDEPLPICGQLLQQYHLGDEE